MEEHTPRAEAVRRLKARFLLAIQTNDAQEVLKILHTTSIDIDTVLEVEDKNMILASYMQGYWVPAYKLELSWAMGLHVCMMYDAVETAVVLLEKGAAVNRKPNGKSPLHVACNVAHGDCVALLLGHGAKVNSFSLSGHTPLHYCITKESVDCAKQLLLKGASVNMATKNKDEDTPLHTAARFGIPELVALYVAHGADVNARNSRLETPLITAAFWAFSTREQTYSAEHHLVCRMLLDYRADPTLQEEDSKAALHKAAWNCDHTLMLMLLEAGAHACAMDINGCAPIQYVLKVTQVRPMAMPELCFQVLLNFGAARIYPPQFHKVLQACYDRPRAVEVMVNSYDHIKATKKWRTSIPEVIYKVDSIQIPRSPLVFFPLIHLSSSALSVFGLFYQQHQDFYHSLFTICSNTPRSLLHLARCTVRASIGPWCHCGIQELPLPPTLKRYLLLEPEGVVY